MFTSKGFTLILFAFGLAQVLEGKHQDSFCFDKFCRRSFADNDLQIPMIVLQALMLSVLYQFTSNLFYI